MKTLVRLFILFGVLAALGAVAYRPTAKYLAKRNRPIWRTAKVEQGSIIAVVNSTGTVKPKIEVTVGSFVSGPIQELYCEFNQEVKKGDLLAKIDPQLYTASVAHDRATLAIQEADVFRVESQLLQAIEDEKRAIALRTRGGSYISQADFDKFKFARMSLEAQVKVSKATVEQARASLSTSLANLNYTEIRSPVDGIVINRKIDPGQTVAAQFQTPELFTVAPDIRKEIRVHASVDEADIGQIKQAQKKKYPVTFTVDAYPDKLFKGNILEIRLSSTTTQNVVTYPVVVATTNPDLELLPGMTASLSFQVDERPDVIKVSSSALRFYPTAAQVRPEDVAILEGREETKADADNNEGASTQSLSIAERARLRKERSKHHVWVADGDGDHLRAIEVKTGLTDGQYTEILPGTIKTGDVLVIGVQPPAASSLW
ncbi:MAG TPA: efflux RND transporter periplasmic adaptor subunit [Planctomycetaceae bacterium]|jgi:HlyD family secretion protein|nr:efflux RND transporter periplasmic adaptor subunit [Planctomycetaceae bacterium]